MTDFGVPRVLPDGRILVLYKQIYNNLLTISTPASYRLGTYIDSY